eukprot:SAG31_NODE_4292_length_3375_cov_9.381868_4_plen_252_part_00
METSPTASATVTTTPPITSVKPVPKMADDDTTAFVWACCAEIIGEGAAEKPSAEDNLLELGLDSLGLAELVNQIKVHFGDGSVSIEHVLTNPTLSGVAAQVLQHKKSRKATKVNGSGTVPARSISLKLFDSGSTIDAVRNLCVQVIGDDAVAEADLDPDTVLLELGIDSLGLAELVNQIDLHFGEGRVKIEDVIGATLGEVSDLLSGAVLLQPTDAKGSGVTESKSVGTAVGAAFAVDSRESAQPSFDDSA